MTAFEQAVLKAKTMVEENTKVIPCAYHNGEAHAILYVFPHLSAGIWECGEASGTCEHEATHTEYEESFDGRAGNIEVCDACEVEIVRGL